jgi:hypothetical protein
MGRVLHESVAKFVGRQSLSAGFSQFLESRSFFMRAAIVITCWLGKMAPGIWPFSLVARFLQANALLFENAVRQSLGPAEDHSGDSSWANHYYDVVVVGSGPGGSVSALRHLEQGLTVLLVEEGPDVSASLSSHHSVAQAQTQLRDLGFQVIYGTTPVAFAQGRTVGGGSEVNSGLYHRVPEPYRSRLLSEIGCSDAEWAALELKVERDLDVQTAPASFLLKYRKPAKDFIAGSAALGLEVEEVARWRTYQPETHNGMKNTYLRKYVDSGGVLVSQKTVTRLTEQSDYVRVDVLSAGGSSSVRCGEVIVAAGAIETVRLLKSSRLLRGFIHPLGFHPMVRVLAEHTDSVNEDGHFPPYQSWDNRHEFKFGFSVSTFNYLRATYTALTGDMINPGKLSKVLAYFASFTLKDSRAFSLLLAKRAFNWIIWGSADKRRLRQAEATLSEALLAGGAKQVLKGKGKPTVSSVHLFGSLPLGASRAVDSRGKVTRTDRVFVCDSSLMPVAPWVNPQGPIMVLCELVTSRKLAH